jgi:hypothetical protein
MAKKRPRSDARIYLQDECPAMGSGERGIQIVSVGPKWARFKETATQVNCRVPRSCWDRARIKWSK